MQVRKKMLEGEDKLMFNTLVGSALAAVYDRGIYASKNVIKKIEYHIWNGKSPYEIGKLFAD